MLIITSTKKTRPMGSFSAYLWWAIVKIFKKSAMKTYVVDF